MYNTNQENKLLTELYKVAESKKHDAIKCKEDVILQCLPLRKKKTEMFVAIFLDNSNRIIKKYKIKGTVDQAAIYPREILKSALLNNVRSIILVHNHPGGCNFFSEHDKKVTKIIADGCKLFGITLLDHVLIYDTGHKSMKNTVHWFE